jgi:CRP-like cAMP-binding protein
MLDAISYAGDRPAESSQDEGIARAVLDHPVLRLMPDEVQDLIRERGQSRSLRAGECATGRAAIGFVMEGALAAFDRRNIACVGLHGRGSMFGWEASLASTFVPAQFLPMLDTRWIEAPAEDLANLMGRTWVEHVFARHALDRLTRIQAEAACNAVHQVPHRTAKWVLRLYQIAGSELRTTQAILAQAMGVQRTRHQCGGQGLGARRRSAAVAGPANRNRPRAA